MAACIHSAQTNRLSCDPNRSQVDDHLFNFAKFCRPNYPDHVSCEPIAPNKPKTIHSRTTVDDDDLWLRMKDEARSDVDQEPILSSYYFTSILSHDSLGTALGNHLSLKLSDSSLPSGTLYDLFLGMLAEDQEIMNAVKDDLRAVKERDPACIRLHISYGHGRKILALLIQNKVSEMFAVDIHPGAKIGRGILLDHATGVVVGETAVIGNNVSILHNVTLGGTGKACGDRHPKIGDGVLIGAGTCVLGNVRIGDGAKIGAGSVVLKEVSPRTTAVGNPARLIGGKENPIRLDKIPSFTMDHTSHICKGKRSKTNNLASNPPPGPRKLPLIGNLHQLAGSLPHHALRDLANKHGPLMSLQFGEVPTVIISSPEIAKEVMKTHDLIFATRPQILATKIMTYGFTNIAFAPYGEYWRQIRKICTLELLSAKCVQSFRSIREEESSNFIRWIALKAGSPINLTQKIYSSAYSITSRAAFGNKTKDQESYILIMEETAKAASGFNIADFYPSAEWLHLISRIKSKIEKLQKEADRILGNIINEHIAGKATETGKDRANEDLVDALLKYHDHGTNEFSLTIDNIKAIIQDIFSAGSETSATTVDWAMSEMMKNPRIMRKAQAEVRQVFNGKGKVDETGIQELNYLKLVIKETLRLHPALPLLLPRECGERCEINGYEIPVKTKVIINAWAIGRDPNYWSDPECFRLERFFDSSIDFKGNNFEFIPFGAGRRICPGMAFGLANVEMPLAQFLYHFDWKLPGGMNQEELHMTEAFAVIVRRKEDLNLIAVPYKPIPN
ncbi:unnamed protein product [Camellia sinensis]